MMTIEDYIKKILKKKGWNLTKFTEEINKVRKQVGIKGKTNLSNVSAYLNDKNTPIGFKTLVVWERVLGLPCDSLCNLVSQPVTRKTKKDLEEFKKKVRK